jgi:hypothetical protein
VLVILRLVEELELIEVVTLIDAVILLVVDPLTEGVTVEEGYWLTEGD